MLILLIYYVWLQNTLVGYENIYLLKFNFVETRNIPIVIFKNQTKLDLFLHNS